MGNSAEYNKRYLAQHREQLRLRSLARYYANRDRELERMREYSRNNRSRIKARMTVWRANNPDKVKVNNKRSYVRHRRQRIQKTAIYQKRNTNSVRAWQRKWYSKHKTAEQLRSRTYRASYRNLVRARSRTRRRRLMIFLDDNYVKALLTRDSALGFKDIPPELVDLKRLHVQFIREKKQQYGTKKEPK